MPPQCYQDVKTCQWHKDHLIVSKPLLVHAAPSYDIMCASMLTVRSNPRYVLHLPY
jgi:hypothetical protein